MTLRTFDRRYLAWGAPLCLACLLPLAWHWSQPGPYVAGAPFMPVAGVLAVAGLVLNLPSFWLQRRSFRAQWESGIPVRAGHFALRFYLINLGLAVALSVLLWQPLLMLLFSSRLYPVAFWLMPYHALLGWLLGRWLERETRAPAARARLEPARRGRSTRTPPHSRAGAAGRRSARGVDRMPSIGCRALSHGCRRR